MFFRVLPRKTSFVLLKHKVNTVEVPMQMELFTVKGLY